MMKNLNEKLDLFSLITLSIVVNLVVYYGFTSAYNNLTQVSKIPEQYYSSVYRYRVLSREILEMVFNGAQKIFKGEVSSQPYLLSKGSLFYHTLFVINTFLYVPMYQFTNIVTLLDLQIVTLSWACPSLVHSASLHSLIRVGLSISSPRSTSFPSSAVGFPFLSLTQPTSGRFTRPASTPTLPVPAHPRWECGGGHHEKTAGPGPSRVASFAPPAPGAT